MEAREFDIHLYRGPAQEYYGVVPFVATVRLSLEQMLQRDLAHTRISLRIHRMPEEMFGRIPSSFLRNLIPEYGYITVQVFRADDVERRQPIYQHPHLVSELVTSTLESGLRRAHPEESSWSFRIDIPGMPTTSTMRPAPVVEGAVRLPEESLKAAPFSIRRLPQPKLPVRALEDFGTVESHRAGSGPINVVLSPEIRDDLLQRPYLSDMEDGGFIIGQTYQDADHRDRVFVEVREAIPARYSGASMMHFIFTCDSFSEFKELLRKRATEDRVLGWYHTHLFPATNDFGLSWFDVHLHHSTFTVPWQIAGLINIDGDVRVLRFFSRRGDAMVEAPCWVVS